MKQKKGIDDFDMSEPEFLIRVMDRHQDWCVIVCLIGGGQEINTGEAGVTEWISALRQNYPNWNIYYSDKVLNEPVYLAETEQKKWLKTKAKGSERYGVIASSGARRLKADGIDVKNKISPADWFLNYKTDVRSSYYLEEIATEFDIQGLEIDFTCLAWDINFYYDNGWRYQSFKGTCWQQIKQNEKQKYLLNAYRMLLTRARQGMVIYIPNVDDCDWTRPKSKYDSTYKYLKTCGFEEII